MNCKNCQHPILKNYYGGYIHTHQDQDRCAIIKSYAMHLGNPKTDQCGCTKPKGE